jgi:hypothetical protein
MDRNTGRRRKFHPWSNRNNLVDRSVDFVERSFGVICHGHDGDENDRSDQEKQKHPFSTLYHDTPDNLEPYCVGSSLSTPAGQLCRTAAQPMGCGEGSTPQPLTCVRQEHGLVVARSRVCQVVSCPIAVTVVTSRLHSKPKSQRGEQTALTCAMAWFRQLSSSRATKCAYHRCVFWPRELYFSVWERQ